MTTKAQRRAQARYDATRPKGVLVRFEEIEMRELDSQRKEGESRPAAIKRLLRLHPNAANNRATEERNDESDPRKELY